MGCIVMIAISVALRLTLVFVTRKRRSCLLTGMRLDTLARTSLWEAGLDYRHGTGHGVGSFLNVHEGPCGISYRPRADDMGLEPGMILSNGCHASSNTFIFMFRHIFYAFSRCCCWLQIKAKHLKFLATYRFTVIYKYCVYLLPPEPGYYEDGKFGIRLESLVLVVKADTKVESRMTQHPSAGLRFHMSYTGAIGNCRKCFFYT